MKKQSSKVKILAPRILELQLTACSAGDYIRFPNVDSRANPRWRTNEAYQYLGAEPNVKNARILHVESGTPIASIPRTENVLLLELVSIELQPAEG